MYGPTLRCNHYKTKNNMTHVKNAEAFTRMVNFCTGYGGKYNPGRQNLRIESLSTQLETVRQVLEQVISTKTHYDNEVNRRKQAFDQLPRLVSSILRTLEASGASPEKLDDARQFVHQISGMVPKSREPLPSDQAQGIVSKRSRLQLAYVSKADSFAKLVQSVISEPLYQAFEPELSPTGLVNKAQELNQLNQQVGDARQQWSNARINRELVMYGKGLSLYETAKAVRKYVRAIYGHDSGQYAQVKALQFVKLTRK